jgi:hypothetical protein
VVLHWAALCLFVIVGCLALAGTLLQVHQDRQNRHRIARYQAWETQLADFLFKGGYEHGTFGPIDRKDRWLFRDFLARYQFSFAGLEAEILRQLYLDLGIHTSLPERLQSQNPRDRAKAAAEISAFCLGTPSKSDPPAVAERPWRWKPGQSLEGILGEVLPLLDEPIPWVAYAAAMTLSRSRDLRFAAPVLSWVMREDSYQRERLLQVLEGFGPDLLTWMKDNLESPDQNPEPWVLFALLVGSHRHMESQPRLVWLLSVRHVNLRVSVLKALILLADPSSYSRVLPYAKDPAWEIRIQAARALGVLGGPAGVPDLLSLITDPVFDVRRSAAQSLLELGHAGREALVFVSEDPSADPFARDIARERLEWVDERGHL